MKHFSAASRMRSRWYAARTASPLPRTSAIGSGFATVLLPASAQRFVQRHAIALFRQPRRDQSLLRDIKTLLRIEQRQIAVSAGLVTLLREFICLRGGIDQCLLRAVLSIEGGGQCQRIGNVAEACLDRLLV